MKLIGTPDRFFYAGMPPKLLGGSGPNTVFITPSLILTEYNGFFRASLL